MKGAKRLPIGAGAANARRITALALLLASGCSDPVRDGELDALGPEAAGIPPGPDHRPGQPCLACHGGQGPASLVMSFAGTVYGYLDSNEPAGGAVVHLLDAESRTYAIKTNCAGNFWIPASDFVPKFPVKAGAQWGTATEAMRTILTLDGSCNACHTGPQSAGSPGHVYMLPASQTVPEESCP